MCKLESHHTVASTAGISFPLRLRDLCLLNRHAEGIAALLGISRFCVTYMACVELHLRKVSMETRVKQAPFCCELKIKTSGYLHDIFTPQITIIPDWKGFSEYVTIWCHTWLTVSQGDFQGVLSLELLLKLTCLKCLLSTAKSTHEVWVYFLFICFFLPMNHTNISIFRRIIRNLIHKPAKISTSLSVIIRHGSQENS